GPATAPLETVCPLEHGAFSCPAPAGVWDLKVRVAEHSSSFLWGRRVVADATTDLGDLVVVPGGSVAGFVVVPDRRQLPEVVVYLAPAVAGDSQATRRAARADRLTSRVDERGFFAFRGVLAGTYELEAVLEGAGRGEFGPVLVVGTGESFVRDAIRILALRNLEVAVSPPLDPAGERWRVVLEKRTSPNATEPRGEQPASESGVARFGDLPAGTYAVRIRDAAGQWWHLENREIREADEVILITLDLLPVRGEVTLGDEPLAARLGFGAGLNGIVIEMESDAEGRFAGVLPRDGVWLVSVVGDELGVRRTFRAEVEKPPGASEAFVEIRLEDRLVEGEVVDTAGRPVAGARVTAKPLLSGLEGKPLFVLSGDDGRFVLRGLDAGAVELRAAHGKRSSALRRVEVRAAGEEVPPEKLVLEDEETLRGTVLGEASPALGALVAVSGRGFAATTTTDARGEFRILLPVDTPELSLAVMSPGHALHLETIAAGDRRHRTVRLGRTQGVFVLGLARGGRRSPVFVAWNGRALDFYSLFTWQALQGGTAPGGGAADALRVPGMPPGEYLLCAVGTTGEVNAPMAAPTCVSGLLAPDGELRLDLP
ncbi:MAG TPA: carboxypeptidase regulatory-like domain-containing protein, partial [Thermoanaerobaculia bacterium]|nr:carboxypeptidase regulatory-like domain-containing protein [Thermoanaerobaculia bacterium]